tara:strand:- start:4615 stop:4845 length:231 start_codon:yes stop_codon:yes gene_type:complete
MADQELEALAQSRYRVRVHAGQSTKGIVTIDCTVEYNFDTIPELKDTSPMNALLLLTIEHAEERFRRHGYSLATKQ